MLINLITKGDRLLINTCTEHGQGQRRLDSNFREPTWLLICFHGRTCLPSRGCAHTNDTDVCRSSETNIVALKERLDLDCVGPLTSSVIATPLPYVVRALRDKPA